MRTVDWTRWDSFPVDPTNLNTALPKTCNNTLEALVATLEALVWILC